MTPCRYACSACSRTQPVGIEISTFRDTAHFADDLGGALLYHDGFTHVIGRTWMKWLGRVGRTGWVLVVYGWGKRERRAACVHVMLAVESGGVPAYSSVLRRL